MCFLWNGGEHTSKVACLFSHIWHWLCGLHHYNDHLHLWVISDNIPYDNILFTEDKIKTIITVSWWYWILCLATRIAFYLVTFSVRFFSKTCLPHPVSPSWFKCFIFTCCFSHWQKNYVASWKWCDDRSSFSIPCTTWYNTLYWVGESYNE